MVNTDQRVRTTRPQVLGAAMLLGLLALAGCDTLDPYTREGAWRPAGVNQQNLTAMVASPGDLAQGREDHSGNGQFAAQALDRLRRDKVRPLPDSAISKVVPVSVGSSGNGSGSAGN